MITLDTNDQIEITPGGVIEDGVAVLGSRRTGKSNTVALLIELLIAYFPFIIADAHDEYWSLRELFPFVIVGHAKSKHKDLVITPESAAAFAEHVYANGLSVMLELLMFDDVEREALVLAFFGRLWDLAISADHPKSFGVVLEEAQNFIPEGMKPSPVRSLMKRLALEGGKFGFGMILATQTTTEISKTVLKQMGLRILHRVNDSSDIQRYQQNVPMKSAEVESIVRDLARGEAIVVRGGQADRVMIRKRQTFHVGSTPLVDVAPPPLKQIDAAMLEGLQAALQQPTSPADASPEAAERIAWLENELGVYKRLAEEREDIIKDGFKENTRLQQDLGAAHDDVSYLKQEWRLDHQDIVDKLTLLNGMIEGLLSSVTGDDLIVDQLNNHYGMGLYATPLPEDALAALAAAKPEAEIEPGPDDVAPPPGPALNTGRENILRILQRINTVEHRSITVNELAVQAMYAPKGGGFLRAMKLLRDSGLIVTRPNGNVELTDLGIIEAWNMQPWKQTPEALVEAWCNKLQTSAARILPELARRYPEAVAKTALAAALDYAPTGGGFLRGMKLLRSSNLIETDDFGAVAAASGLFLVDDK